MTTSHIFYIGLFVSSSWNLGSLAIGFGESLFFQPGQYNGNLHPAIGRVIQPGAVEHVHRRIDLAVDVLHYELNAFDGHVPAAGHVNERGFRSVIVDAAQRVIERVIDHVEQVIVAAVTGRPA